MAWTYAQDSGKILDSTGKLLATGYSGNGMGLNNPALEDIHNIGPIPCGEYHMQSPLDTARHGPYAIALVPTSSTDTHGRSDFMIHGDEIAHVGQHLASEGCIILAHADRVAIWESGDHDLEVVASVTIV